MYERSRQGYSQFIRNKVVDTKTQIEEKKFPNHLLPQDIEFGQYNGEGISIIPDKSRQCFVSILIGECIFKE